MVVEPGTPDIDDILRTLCASTLLVLQELPSCLPMRSSTKRANVEPCVHRKLVSEMAIDWLGVSTYLPCCRRRVYELYNNYVLKNPFYEVSLPVGAKTRFGAASSSRCPCVPSTVRTWEPLTVAHSVPRPHFNLQSVYTLQPSSRRWKCQSGANCSTRTWRPQSPCCTGDGASRPSKELITALGSGSLAASG